MTDFLDTIESLKASDERVGALFQGEGRRLGGGAKHPEWERRLAEAVNFVADVRDGRLPAFYMREALSTSDFPLMFGQIIDRMLLANYQHTPPTYRDYAKVSTVADFRTVYRFALNGGEATLSQVGELAEYPVATVSEARYTYNVAKYGKILPISWEAMVDDQLGAFDDIPSRFATAARNTEEKFVTQLFVDVNGPHASLYTSGHKNIVTGLTAGTNPPLTIQSLQDAMTILSKQTDADGNPIVIKAIRLVVPPALQVVANNILNATQIWTTGSPSGGGPPLTTATTGGQQLVTANWMSNLVQLSVNAFIPIVASSANGNTSWFLFADANVGRPALEVGFLRGHESPELFMKEPDAVRIGGGALQPQDGDFETDSVVYKVRHVIGGTTLDFRMTAASNGAGS